MDGTLYLGDTLFDFTKELLSEIKKQSKRYLFMTNNSSKSVDAYIEKLKKLGIDAEYDDFITSSQVTAAYLKENHKNAKLYVCGTASFKDELKENGFTVTENIDEVDVIVLGFDTELTFKKLEDACILLNRGVDYIATNPDWVCPTWYGSVPDCGSISQILKTATGREPYFIGKPRPEMIYLAMEKTGFSAYQTVIIGDRLYTDIASGANAGISSLFVLSGEGTIEDLEKSDIKPTYIFENIRKLCTELISCSIN